MSKQNDAAAAAAGGQQSIEQLQSRFAALDKKRTQAETTLEHAVRDLESLKSDAKQQYGTDDLDALREKLAVMTRENEEKRSKYQADLDRIESELADVERKFTGTDAATNDEAGRG